MPLHLAFLGCFTAIDRRLKVADHRLMERIYDSIIGNH